MNRRRGIGGPEDCKSRDRERFEGSAGGRQFNAVHRQN